MGAKKTHPVAREMLKRLEASGGKDRDALADLAKTHEMAGRPDEAMGCIMRMLSLADDREERAHLLLSSGQLSEQKGDFAAAERYYRATLSMGPENPAVRYFAHNNLGFSLNQLGRFDEAMPYLLEAARIEPGRSNAFKNLGLAFQGLGRYEKAVEQFVEATRADATDGRSIRHLEELLNEHPELYDTVPSIEWMLGECRRAVAQARAARSLVN